jgi:hypothetical protein
VALSGSREEIARWLRQYAPVLKEPYEAAVVLMETPDFPARLHLVGHCVREICNRLPDYYPGATRVVRARVDYATHVRAIAASWTAAGMGLDGSVLRQPREGGLEASEPAAIPLPAEIVEKLAGLLLDHSEASGTNREAARAVYAAAARMGGDEQVLAANVGQWLGLARWGVGVAHVRQDGTAPSSHDVDDRFRLFEAALLTLIGSVSATMDELDAILEDTNS